MAQDADGDYYYTEGTLNEQLDDFGVYEKDGRVYVHYKPEDNTVGFAELATVLGGERDTPTTDELADGEYMIYADGGDVVVARNVDDTIETEVFAADADFAE